MKSIEEKYITYKRAPFFQIAKDLIKDGDVVLDVGAGDGSFSEFCQNDEIYQFDGNMESFNNLKKKFRNTFLGHLPNLPFQNNFFNIIHCSHVIEHLQPQELYDTLIEFDRVLKDGGRIVISAPLLWSGFYDDLSHVKPYSPNVLSKYLCPIEEKNTTRPKISSKYKVEKLKFRYLENYNRFNFHYRGVKFIGKTVVFLFLLLKKTGFLILEKTGYTMVLKKTG